MIEVCPLSADWGSVADWVSGIMSFAAVSIALWLGLKSSSDQRARDRRSERSSAHKTLTKMVEMINAFNDMRKHFCISYDTAKLAGPDGEKWPQILAVSGMLDPMAVRLDSDETDLLLRVGNTDFMMQLMLLVRRYEASVDAAKEYRTARSELVNMMPPPSTADGREGEIYPDESIFLVIQPRSAALEHSLSELVEMLNDSWELTLKVSARMPTLFRSYFKDESFPALNLPSN